ncbi:MAG: cytochrome c [Planctomycetales bacterium]|nr:cytochrome c [Planctomycetales bacterium]
MTRILNNFNAILLGTATVVFTSTTIRAQDAPPVSSFAAPDVLIAEITDLADKTKESVATEKSYDAATARVEKDAATLAALAVAVGLHDQDNALKSAAPALLHAARKLAECDNQADASAAFAEVEAALKSGAGEQDDPSWDEPAAAIQSLMKQVTYLNTQVRRSIRSGKIRRPESVASSATVLAVLGQAIVCDGDDWASDDEQLAAWETMAAEMRGAAVALRDAALANDGAAADAAKDRVEQSCKTCHDAFDIDET